MGRQEGPREGYVLLEAVRATGSTTPFFICAGSSAPKHQREAASRGAQGSTNIADELIEMDCQGTADPYQRQLTPTRDTAYLLNGD